MNCKEAYICLLTSERPAEPALELRRHLLRCARCRKRQARLLRLEAELTPQSAPSVMPASFADQLEARPIVLLSFRGMSLARWRSRLAVFASAAVVMVGLGLVLGWWLAWQVAPSRHEPAGPIGVVAAGPRESVVTAVLETDLQLAEAIAPGDQVVLLSDIAGELQAEAHRLALEGTPEDVLLLSGLYERVVCRGIVGRAQFVPAEHRKGLIDDLLRRLNETAAEYDRLVETVPAPSREALRTVADAARTARRALTSDAPIALDLRTPPWQPARSGTVRDLLAALVLQALLLAEEPDPLRRADYCNELAEHLVQSILLASSGGDTDRATRFGGFLGLVMDRGVAGNLERFKGSSPEDPRQAEVEQISQRSVKAVEVLELNLAKAPPAALPGLEKALEASAKGKAGPSDKGPPAKGKKLRGLPPGLHKALENGKPLPPNLQKRLSKDGF